MKKPKSSKKSKSNYLKQPDIQRTPSMRDSVHIDSAITRFPAPPSTPEKTDILKRLSSLKPRSAGYNPDRLEELRELILTNKKICDVVIEEPETTSKSRLPRVEQRNGWFSQALFLSRSKHPSSRRKRLGNYRHIVIDQLYDGEHNASTYKVNGTRGLENTFFGEDQKKQISLAMDVEKTVEGESNEPAAKRTNPNQDVAPQCGIDQKTDVLQTSLMNGNIVGENDLELFKRGTDTASTPLPNVPLSQSLSEKYLGLSKEYGHLLAAGGDRVAKPTSSIAPPVPVSRDFATGSSTLIQTSGISSSDHLQNQPIAGAGSVDSSVNPRTSRVIRCTSRSPVKKGSTRAEVGGARRQPLAMSPEIRRTILQDSNPGNVGFLSEPRAAPNKSMPVTSTLEVHRQDRSEKSCCCLPGDVQSKPLSLISAESTAEDVHSDTSSAIISNAQRAITTHVQGSAGYYGGCLERPPIPGPAPDRALPSLPEDHGSNAPATPRRCGSSQQPARTDRSPARIVPPLRSPWKAKYNLYPAIDSSPTKRPASPVRLNTATEGEQLVSLLSSPSSLKRHAIAFGSADQLPASMSVGALDQLKRLEDTKAMKRRDLARMGSRKGAVTKTETSTAKSRRESGFHEGIIDLPTWPLQDTDDSACFSARHNRAQASQVSNLSASTTLQQRESRKYSPQELSPIIVIAEQKPVSPITGQPSNSSDLNRNSGRRIDEGPRIRKTNGFNHISPQPVSLQEQDIEGRLRPLSAHSIPAPRPVASRVPTPYSSPLLREPSQRSSHTPDSSMLLPETSDLEARLSAMEKKNVMLETAFWAVINTPVVCGGGCGLGGLECRREGDDGNRSSGLSSKEEERSSGASETGSLYAGLENLLALHSAAAGGERWCSIIGP